MALRIADLSPTITTMIRMDHTHVLMLFRRFHPDTPSSRKLALATSACRALEIHAQLEEEIFYPALRRLIGEDTVLDKSVPEHDEMRRLIAEVRSSHPDSVDYDERFRQLMSVVLHHVADEETVLLPRAEEVMRDDLSALGMAMTRRRLQLLGPHAGEVASTTARSFPVATAALAASAIGLGVLLLGRRPSGRALSGETLGHAGDVTRDVTRGLTRDFMRH